MSKTKIKGKEKRTAVLKKSTKGTAVLKSASKDKIKPNPSGKKTSILKNKDKSTSKRLDKATPAPKKPAPPVARPVIKLTKEMLEIRQKLQSMLSDMRRDIDHEVRGASARDLAHINDTSDMASDAAEGDLALRIAESETVEASEIERAIEKMDTGTYGICETCNQAIGADRLKFLPYVTLCIKCQELAEIRRREDSDELDDLAEGSEADSENN